jgi:uncharacterized glyoxalase superfamily protein PhnB
MPDLSKRPAVVSALVYRSPMAAFEWLQSAFGFAPAFLITDADGNLAHAELALGDGWIMVGSEWSEDHRSPASLGGRNTQSVHVQVTTDVDAHCAHARQAGAEIIAEPATQFYGDRTYRARDLEGHMWTFAQAVRQVAPEEWDRATGLKTRVWP